MVSILIGLGVTIVAGIIFGIKFRTVWDGLIGAVIIFVGAAFIILWAGILSHPSIVETIDYDLYNVGDGLVYIDDNNQPHNMGSSYSVKVDNNVNKPVRRITKYDNTIFIKFDETSIILPDKYLTKVNS